MTSNSSSPCSLIGALRSPELAADLESYCAVAKDIRASIKVTENSISAAPAIINGGADIVVIEAARASEDDLVALEKICAHVARGGSFIVIMEDPSADTMRRLFRAGVTDVLSTPVTTNELVAALGTARGRKVAARDPGASAVSGKIVTILKTAGGVGATTIGVNVGAALSGFVEGRVALVDLDIQFGQVATALDISPRMTVLDALRAGSRLDAMLLASTLHRHDSGLDVLAAPAEITPLNAITDDFVDQLLANLRATAAISLIELPMAWSQWAGHVLDRSDLIIPVAEASVKSASGAARINQSLVDFGITKPNIHLLISNYEKTIENNDRAKKIGEIFRVKPAGAIREDAKAAREAADRGLLFSVVAPKSAATRDFETAARSIATLLGAETVTQTNAGAPLARLLAGKLPARGRTA